MKNKPEVSRRDFFQSLLQDTIRLSLEIKHNCREGIRAANVLETFEDYPIAQTYPRELFEEEARRLGIDIDAVGETEAIRRIMAIQIDHGKA
ncbi:MAG: hypothetical protein D4R73_06090 [Deltaproteobacteria bacterium]|nr:MAG: hypothetical protein D4R73_06090 [Deltaproteobacteria bacterium]